MSFFDTLISLLIFKLEVEELFDIGSDKVLQVKSLMMVRIGLLFALLLLDEALLIWVVSFGSIMLGKQTF